MNDDAPLHVETRGRRRAPDVQTFLLLHGFGASTYSWRHWLPRLEERGRVVLVDMKGFGRADKPDDGRYTPAHQVELIERLVDREDPSDLTVVGHSFGGGVALMMALEMTSRGDPRLTRLVIVAGAAYGQKLPPFVALAGYPRLTTVGLRWIGPERVVRRVLRSIVFDQSTVDEDQVRAYAAPLRSEEGVRGMIDVARHIVPERLDVLTDGYPRIHVPALLLWGRHDRVIPLAIGQRLQRALPNATLEVLEECGHIPHEELPAESLGRLEAFLNAS